MLCHDAGAAAQHHPGQQRAKQSVADACPGGSNAVFPAKLSCIAYKNHSGEVAGAIGEGSEPRADRAAAQHKAIDVGSVAAAVETDTHHNGKED